MKWEDVSLEKGTALMWRSVVELKGQPPKIRNSTKTGNRRVVPLMPGGCVSKEPQGTPERRTPQAKRLWQDEDIVFPNSRGGPMTRANLTNRHYKPILKNAGLPKETRMYDLRHTFATLWVESGEGIEMLSGVLGHARISTTSDRYVHPSNKAREEAMGRFGKRLSGGR
jgi:integrase